MFAPQASYTLQATLREANRLLSDQGAPPLVDIGGIVNEEAAAALAAKRSSGVEAAADVPLPVVAGVKKMAIAPAGVAASKAPGSLPAPAGKIATQVETRAKSPAATFLTGGGWEGDDDDLAKARLRQFDNIFLPNNDHFFQEFIIGYELDARLHALQELLGIDRSRALREAINSDKRNDHSKLAKLAASFRQLKADNASSDAARSAEIDALHVSTPPRTVLKIFPAVIRFHCRPE